MTFNRVTYRPDGSRHVSCSMRLTWDEGRDSSFHGHTGTTRRQLRAWDTAVSAWRHLQASESGELPYTVEPTGAALAARSWEFLAGSLVVSPSAIARGF